MNGSLQQIQDWMLLVRRAKWSVARLAGLCGVSTRTLERHFQETHNQTPEAWLADMRWRQALELLCEGASVKATASEVGYRQASTFSREFKKRFGQSPVDLAKPPAIKPLSARMSRKAMKLSL